MEGEEHLQQSPQHQAPQQQQAVAAAVEEHRIARGLLLGRYQSDEFWPVALDFFARLKRTGVASGRQLLSPLLDLLWSAGRRGTASRLYDTVVGLGIFPEATFCSTTLHSLDVHRMSQGAAVLFLYRWLLELQESAVLEPEQLPPLFSIVTRWGDETPARDGDTPPVAKAIAAAIQSLELPFTPAPWNSGQWVADRATLLPWLEGVGETQCLSLVDSPLPQEVFNKRSAVAAD
eukprot:TRINITY_DN18265_c1_g1_i1.p1 TRINITY_DN18265_c1_g1~~TRINITY_DN18265_c1_g1_i1.p1  ORF type:complete len:264 (+),score=-1.97 TRINITY_DN18265_c1_g1_i1:95-793(+)